VTVVDLEPLYRRYWALYHVGTAEFIRFMGYSELAKIAKQRNDPAAARWYKQRVVEAATAVVTKYYYAQSYDDRGWMWQPVNSLFEYLGFYNYTPYEYISKLTTQPDVLNDVLNAIETANQ
jgi:hypothetical protein